MLEVLHDLVRALGDRRPVAYCRLVETRGSTPQKAGAAMLVYPDGSQAGTLGGGCVEAEVKRRAISILDGGQAEIATFQLDSDYGWDDGLICGGRMQVLVEPLIHNDSLQYFSHLASVAQGSGGTEVIAFDAEKTPLYVPSTYLLNDEGDFRGSLRGSVDDLDEVRQHLRPLQSRPRAYAAGGLAYLPLLPRCRLLIVGGGHVGKAVSELAVDLDFDVWVVDDRADIVSEQRFPRAQRRISGAIDQVLADLEITADTYCLIVTRGHNHDEKALYYLAERGARYVGMIGSRRKIKMILEDLVVEGISREALQRVHAPVGIDIGSQSVAEIAVSIAAELVAYRNVGRIPGRPESVTLVEQQ